MKELVLKFRGGEIFYQLQTKIFKLARNQSNDISKYVTSKRETFTLMDEIACDAGQRMHCV